MLRNGACQNAMSHAPWAFFIASHFSLHDTNYAHAASNGTLSLGRRRAGKRPPRGKRSEPNILIDYFTSKLINEENLAAGVFLRAPRADAPATMRNPDAAARSETGLDRQLGHLRRAARAVFPCGYVDKLLTNAGNKMRCGLAQWLLEQRAVVAPAGAPPVSGEYLTGAPVPLTSVEAYLRQQHAGLWLNRTVFKWPKPADFLRHADSHGIFLVLQTAADAPQGGGGGGGAGAAAGGQYPAVMLDGGALAAVFLEDAERGYGGSRPPGASDAAVLADSAAANVALAKAVAALARDAFPGATASDLTNVAPYGVHAVTDPAQRSAVARVYSAAEAACHVRRALVGWLAASRRLANVAPLSAPMSTLGESLRKEHAGLWAECDPSGGGRPPKLKDFLLQPESRGVFRVWAAGEAASSSSAGPAGGRQMVELQVDALWFAALRYTAPLSLLHPDLASWSAAAGPSSAAGSSTAPLESAAAAPGTSGRAALGRPPMAAAAAAAAPLNASAAPAPAAASEAQLEALRSKPVQELARMAFPTHVHGQPVKDQPARQLRRAIAAWLDGDADAAQGLGPRRARLSGLGHFLKRQHADVWLDPKRKWPKLKDFLTQPQSRGVFQLLPSPTLVASDVGVPAWGRSVCASCMHGFCVCVVCVTFLSLFAKAAGLSSLPAFLPFRCNLIGRGAPRH